MDSNYYLWKRHKVSLTLPLHFVKKWGWSGHSILHFVKLNSPVARSSSKYNFINCLTAYNFFPSVLSSSDSCIICPSVTLIEVLPKPSWWLFLIRRGEQKRPFGPALCSEVSYQSISLTKIIVVFYAWTFYNSYVIQP